MHTITKAQCDDYTNRFKKLNETKTLNIDREGHRFTGKELSKLDLTKDITILMGADAKGNLRPIITDGTIILQKPVWP